jgi:dihydroorotase
MMDDLRIIGGHLLDPGNGIDQIGDVAVSDGRIRAVGQVEPGPARRVMDAAGLLVTPGLVDLHTHLHAGSTFWGLRPDPIAWYTGVTTWVDAGSAGAYGLAALLRARQSSGVRSYVLLHIAAHGLAARTGESRDLDNLDVGAAVSAIAANRDVVRGIKVRMDASTVGENHLEPLRLALRAGEEAGVPVMVHIGRGPFTLDEVVDLLRPGDIITHCAGPAAAGIATPGAVRQSLRAAYERGVIFDLGHGAGGFSFDVVESYLSQGMPPHVISTDLHLLSANGPAFDLPTVMAKLLAAGMSLAAVVRAATRSPASALGLDAGGLAAGSPADVAVFRQVEGDWVVGDVHGVTRTSPVALRNVATYVAGRPLPPEFPAPPPGWVQLSDAQRAALERREHALRSMLSEPLVHPRDVQNQIPPASGRG